MATSRVPKSWIAFLLIVLVLLGGLGALQVWSALATRDMVQDAISAPLGTAKVDVEQEKARQEAIGHRIENRSKALLQTNLASALGASLGVLISASGALLAVFTYLAAREKERADRLDELEKDREDRRQAQEKDRLDRLGGALSETLGWLVAGEPRQRVVGAAGLLPFFAPDRSDFHLQAFSALLAAARTEDEPPEVQQGVRLALEQAARNVAAETLRKLSWQAVRLSGVNFCGCDLSGLDFRDADLADGRLEGAILAGTDLTAAGLQGARLMKADLSGANLTYADLAGASLAGATLQGAILEGAKVLNLDLDGADLRGLAEGWRGVPWDATANWRKARFDPEVLEELQRRYGAEAPDLDVLMLMWEAPPFVAGGTWTACYHLVRRLRRRGAKVTVVVPWERSLIDDSPFGLDVPLIALGIVPTASGDAVTSAYGGGAPSWSPYGMASASSYGGGAYWTPGAYGTMGSYGTTGAYGPGGVYGVGGSYGAYGGAGLAGSVLFRLIGEFRRRLASELAGMRPDVIHAHDWVTFEAARQASQQTGAPWIAHFHSTENDRRPNAPDELTLRIERMGVDSAAGLVVPAQGTRQRLVTDHGAGAQRADVVPNMLSDDPPSTSQMGRFETRRVVFVGRLSEQKGLDRFGAVARAVRQNLPGIRFEVFGDGEQRSSVWTYGLDWRGLLPWDRRGEAYAGASVVVVPSRSEPFGMVILEAMQHRAPVLYPAKSGAAEVLESGVKVDPSDIGAMAGEVGRLLGDLRQWEEIVRAQATEIDAYPRRPDDELLIAVWRRAASAGQEART